MKYNVGTHKKLKYSLIEDLIYRGIVFYKVEMKSNIDKSLKEFGNITTAQYAEDIAWTIKNKLPTSSFIYIVMQNNEEFFEMKNGITYCKGMIAVKNIGFPLNIKKELINLFTSFDSNIEIFLLEDLIKIEDYWDTLTGEYNYIGCEKPVVDFKYNYMYIYHSWWYIQNSFYSDYLDLQDGLFLDYSFCKQFKNKELLAKNLGYDILDSYYYKYERIEGISKSLNFDEEYILFNLITNYMILKGIYVSKGFFIDKFSLGRYSYVLKENYNIEFIRDNIFSILYKLKEELPFELTGVDLKLLVYNNLQKVSNKLENYKILLPSKNLNINFIEFKNGVYDIDNNVFFRYMKPSFESFEFYNNNLDNPIWIIGLFGQEYEERLPKVWLSKLKKKFKKRKLLFEYCKKFGELLAMDDIVRDSQDFNKLLEVLYGEDKAMCIKEKANNYENVFVDLNYFKYLIKEMAEYNEKEWKKVEKELPYIIIYCRKLKEDGRIR